MSIIGKLFGTIGPATPAVSPVSETARPGYDAWYSQQMARSYAARRTTGAVVRLLRQTAHHELPLAA